MPAARQLIEPHLRACMPAAALLLRASPQRSSIAIATFARAQARSVATMAPTLQHADDFLSFVNASPTREGSLLHRQERTPRR